MLKLVQTIVDLAGCETIQAAHLAEALQYRPRVQWNMKHGTMKLYFATPDIAAAHKELTAKGAKAGEVQKTTYIARGQA